MVEPRRTRLAGWGRCPEVDAWTIEGEDLAAIVGRAALTRGLGRSYGDASLPLPGEVAACSVRADRILAFDEATGVLRAEAGLSLARLLRFFLGRGWFVPVTPGTADVTLGGMVAADVHGKNHHVASSFGNHVTRLRLALADGRVVDASEDTDATLFRATVGGMGLTGHILEVSVRMERVPSPWIAREQRAYSDLESLLDGLATAGEASPFTVAWADLLARRGSFGRGILFTGRWAGIEEVERARRRGGEEAPQRPWSIEVPVVAPMAIVRDSTIAAYNLLRYELARRRPRAALESPWRFFYPLDDIGEWHRLYGRRGFFQYQCVLPKDASMRSYRRLLELARRLGPGPFLCVIKDCGEESRGLLSFPKPGVSFALDYPITDRSREVVSRLNEFVAAENGRIYLAKDALTAADQFRAMEPRLGAFLAARGDADPDGRLRSLLSARLFEDR